MGANRIFAADGSLQWEEAILDDNVVPGLDVAALAEELAAQRVRLDAAEDALDHLIVASLDGSL